MQEQKNADSVILVSHKVVPLGFLKSAKRVFNEFISALAKLPIPAYSKHKNPSDLPFFRTNLGVLVQEFASVEESLRSWTNW